MRTSLSSLATVGLFVSSYAAAQRPDARITTRIHARVVELSERDHIPGVSIALFEGGHVVWSSAIGYADLESRVPVDTLTRFQAGSISKPVTAAMALRLAERGTISLDSSVNRYLRAWQLPQSTWSTTPTTIRQLLTHTSGVGVHVFAGYPIGSVPPMDSILDGRPPSNSPAIRVDTTPGTFWYSGGGYVLVQKAISDATRTEFAELASQLVFAPLEMTRSTFVQPNYETSPRDFATGYRDHMSGGVTVPGRYFVYPELAAAGLWTTANNLAKYMGAVAAAFSGATTHRFLSQSSTRQLLTAVSNGRAMSFNIRVSGSALVFNHSGGTQGFRSFVVGSTDGERGIAVLTNSDDGNSLIDELVPWTLKELGWGEWPLR